LKYLLFIFRKGD